MKTLQILLIAPLVLCASAMAPTHLGAQQQSEHVVNRGDTLWDLAQQYLADPFRWQEIFAINQSVVANPDRIYPDQHLSIPGSRTPVDPTAATAAAVPAQAQQPSRSAALANNRSVFYNRASEPASSSSSALSVRGRMAQEASRVPAAAFHSAPRLVPDTALIEVGKLVEVVGSTVIPLRNAPQIQPYDRVYMTTSSTVTVGQTLQLFRRGRAVSVFGRVYHPTGTARVVAVDPRVATVEVDRLFDVVAPGDIAVPLPAFRELPGVDPLPASGLEGVLIGLANDQPIVGREDIAFVNLGTASGVVEGDEFMVYIPPTEADWGIRPGMDVARVQVVRVDLLTSAVRVTEMEQPAIAVGLPVRLIARMP